MSSLSPALPRVFVLGDSISMHYGPALEEALRGEFHYERKSDTAGESGWENLDVAQGANGGNSRQVLTYLKGRQDRNPIAADVLLLNCGLHDIRTDPQTGAKQVVLEEYERNLCESVRVARAMGLEPLWLAICPVIDEAHNTRASFHRYDRDVLAYNAVAERVMTELGVSVVDFYSFCARQLPEGLEDHVHFKSEARTEQGEFIAATLKQWWADRSQAS